MTTIFYIYTHTHTPYFLSPFISRWIFELFLLFAVVNNHAVDT